MIFIEKATLFSLVWTFPILIWRWLYEGIRPIALCYFEVSRNGRYLLGLLERVGLLIGEELEFSYVDIRRPDGTLAAWCIRVEDSGGICRKVSSAIFERSALVGRFRQRFNANRVRIYLEKSLVEEITPALLRINVVSWYLRTQAGRKNSPADFFVGRTLWHEQLREYGWEQGVSLYAYGCAWPLPRIGIRTLWRTGVTAGKQLMTKWMPAKVLPQKPCPSRGNGSSKPADTIAVSYQGKGVTLDQSQNSDLFWVPFAQIPSNQILVYFAGHDDPLDQKKFTLLQRVGIRAVARNESARRSSDLPVWQGSSGMREILPEIWRVAALVIRSLATGGIGLGANVWIAYNLLNFFRQYNDWRNFFYHFHVGMNADYNDWSKERLPADQAISDLGGLAVSYQLADESTPDISRARAIDVHFGFSTGLLESERRSGSHIGQFVAVGYLRDRAFSLVRSRAGGIRRQLLERGVRFIVCFFDENSSDDQRRGPSHAFRGENYRCLLQRLLADETLGLIFKPKKPASLRRRLGPVVDMLDKALATGRCILFEEGVVATPVLPCEASQAADVAIGLLFGTSAALESALAGTPTLLLDREGLTSHPLYALGEGRVVFRDWDSLWDALSSYRRDPSSLPGFGDWSPLLHHMDPFRDGQGARRIGSYLGWLVEGLEGGLSREAAMGLARQRYAQIWGSDKVVNLQNHEEGSNPPSDKQIAVSYYSATSLGS